MIRTIAVLQHVIFMMCSFNDYGSSAAGFVIGDGAIVYVAAFLDNDVCSCYVERKHN